MRSCITAATLLSFSVSPILFRAGTSTARCFTGGLNGPSGIETILLIERADLVGFQVRLVTERAIGCAQDVLGRRYWNRDVGRHSRKQFQFRVIEVNDGVIGDDVLDSCGVHTNLGNAPREGILGVGVHFEGNDLAVLDHAHIGLIGAGIDLHLGEVLRDRKQGRGL